MEASTLALALNLDFLHLIFEAYSFVELVLDGSSVLAFDSLSLEFRLQVLLFEVC